MTIKEVLKKYHKIEIELLLAHVLKKPKEFLFMNGEFKLTSIQVYKLLKMIRRRQKGEPMAYILGYKDFYGLRFKVDKNVLIPRPETEIVIERLKDLKFKDFKQPVRILDVGTGSGCIAVSLAKQFSILNSQFLITASDNSSEALGIAKQNAKIHKVKIRFVKSDLLKNVQGNFDIIIANLPYLSKRWKSPGLKFEPKQALFAKEKGLMIIRRLLEQIAGLMQKPKLVYLEFDPRQKSKLSKLIKKSLPGFKVKFYKDYNNFWRYVEIRI